MSVYKHNKAAFDRLVLCAPFMIGEMHARAENVQAFAEATAPDATPFGTGYKFRFSSESGVRKNVTRRAFGRVTNDDPDSWYIEFGTRDVVDSKGRKRGATEPHYTLTRALDAAGGHRSVAKGF
jgi:hypothetical protein